MSTPALPEEDTIWRMQQECQGLLQETGYRQYEISAYALRGHECRHNLNYWRFGDYLGIGAGAHGKLTDARHHRIFRTSKLKHPAAYLRAAGTASGIGAITDVTTADRIFEFMLNRLRLYEGFSVTDFEAATGCPFNHLRAPLEQAQAMGLMQMTDGHWRPTDRGYSYLNDLQAHFLPEIKAKDTGER